MELIKFEGKPIEKLVEVISQGIGTLYKPRAIRKEAEAEAYKIEVIERARSKAQAESKLFEVETLNLIEQKILYKEKRKQNNIDNIIEVAISQINEEPEITSEKVDKDWTMRFFNIAEDISNEEMQKLWGRILSGEVKKPGSFSLRALELLKNLTKEEAEIFSKICQLKISSTTSSFVLNLERNILTEHFDLTYLDILQLNELGLISNENNLGLTLQSIGKYHRQGFDYGELGIVMETEEAASNKTIKIYKFTKVGIELSTLVQQEINIKYLQFFLQSLSSPFRKLQYGYIKFIDGEKCLTNVQEHTS